MTGDGGFVPKASTDEVKIWVRHSDRTNNRSAVVSALATPLASTATGITITDTTTNADGSVTVTFSDGSTLTIPAAAAARGIHTITRDPTTGVVTVTFDDGSPAQTFTLLDGEDGAPGADGLAKEYIFARTSGSAPSAPSNAWGFDQPQSPWSDNAPNLTSTLHTLYRNQRTIEGAPSDGDSISASWEGSRIVGRFGADGTDGLPGEDGLAKEYIFARTAGTTPSSPSNAWGFDQPQSPWSDNAPNLTATLHTLYRNQRTIEGAPSDGDAVSASWEGSKVVGRYGEDGRIGLGGFDYTYRYTGGRGQQITVTSFNEWFLLNGAGASWPDGSTRLDFYGEFTPVGHFLLLRPGSLFTLYKDENNWGEYTFGSLITPNDGLVCSFRNFSLIESVGSPNFDNSQGNRAIEIHCNVPEFPALGHFTHAYAWTRSRATLAEVDATGEWYLNIGGGATLPYYGWPSAISGIFLYAPTGTSARSDLLGIAAGQSVTLFRNQQSWKQYFVTGVNSSNTTYVGFSLNEINTEIGWPEFDVSTSLLEGYVALYFSL